MDQRVTLVQHLGEGWGGDGGGLGEGWGGQFVTRGGSTLVEMMGHTDRRWAEAESPSCGTRELIR